MANNDATGPLSSSYIKATSTKAGDRPSSIPDIALLDWQHGNDVSTSVLVASSTLQQPCKFEEALGLRAHSPYLMHWVDRCPESRISIFYVCLAGNKDCHVDRTFNTSQITHVWPWPVHSKPEITLFYPNQPFVNPYDIYQFCSALPRTCACSQKGKMVCFFSTTVPSTARQLNCHAKNGLEICRWSSAKYLRRGSTKIYS